MGFTSKKGCAGRIGSSNNSRRNFMAELSEARKRANKKWDEANK